MASQAYPTSSPVHHLSPYSFQAQANDDEFEQKASYDDLIPSHSSPYDRATTTTAAAAVGTYPTAVGQAPDHQRGTSYPFAQQPAYHNDFDSGEGGPPRKGVGWGYPPSPPTKEDVRSLWSKLMPDSIACRLYVLTVLIETSIDLAIEGDLLIRFHDSSVPSRKMSVYLSIFAFAHVFQLAMAIDAVYAKNTLQFLCLTAFNGLFLLYSIIQIQEIRTFASALSSTGVSRIPINVLTTIIPIVISVSELAYIALGYRIYTEFGWKVYKFLGADRRIKKLYAQYQIFQCLIKFDVFLWVGFSVQFIWIVLQKTDWEFYVTVAALPLSIVLLIEGHLGARHENKWMMLTFMSGCVGALVYFIYKLFEVVKHRTDDEFAEVWRSLSTFSVISILMLFITFVFGILVMRSFGHGLKDQLSKNSKRGLARAKSQHRSDGRPLSTFNPKRMSIE